MTTKERYHEAKKCHRVACGGTFMSLSEFAAEPATEQESFLKWLKAEARDVRREARHG